MNRPLFVILLLCILSASAKDVSSVTDTLLGTNDRYDQRHSSVRKLSPRMLKSSKSGKGKGGSKGSKSGKGKGKGGSSKSHHTDEPTAEPTAEPTYHSSKSKKGKGKGKGGSYKSGKGKGKGASRD